MSGNAADNLGRWGAPSTVIPDAIGSHVEPNGELTDNSWHEDAGQNGYGVSPPDPEPVDHSGVEKGNTIHLSPMNLPAASGRHRIDAVEEGDDPALPLNARDVAAFIINKMM
jgi:hypothetical protein